MTQDSARHDEILVAVETAGVRFVNLEFTDVVGMAKSVTIPVDQLPDCLARGKWFDGSALEGFARVAESDMYLFPAVSTFAILPDAVNPQSARHTRSNRSRWCSSIRPTGWGSPTRRSPRCVAAYG